MLALLCYGFCNKRETLGFFKIRGDQKGCYGIYFISIPLFGPFVLLLLEEFLLVFYNSTGLQFIIQMFELVGIYVCIVFYKGVFSYFDQFLYFLGKDLSSFFCIFTYINIIYFVFD